jgi:hypothetical protein
MRKIATMFFAALALAAGALTACHAQVPPTSHSVDLTWTAPVPVSGGVWQTPCGTATGQSPCTYILSRITAANGATGCPVPSGTITYTPINSSSPATGLTYIDSSVSGVTVCYIAQTVQLATTGSASNIAGPFTVPANPGAPTLGNGTVTKLDKPQPPMPPSSDPQVASEQTPKLEGHIQ